ncbi:MAG: DUF368 domain-containing protein [Aristaeellaceae bacterium]
MKKWLLDVLKGFVIGIANIIPGVSGGTMMVIMGVYDKLIYCINNVFKQFVRCIRILLPYIIGILVALVGASKLIIGSMDAFPLPTAFAFIGLIMGGLPAILAQVRDVKRTPVHWAAFAVAFVLLVGMQFMPQSADREITLNLGQILLITLMGAIASSTMIIPGVSGSMMLMILGYYRPIFGSIGDLVNALLDGQWASVGQYCGILIPFVIGMVLGILGISRLIEVMLSKWKGLTYAIILGLVVPSPIVIVMSTWQEQALTMASIDVGTVIASIVTCAIGVFIAAYVMPRLDARVKDPEVK